MTVGTQSEKQAANAPAIGQKIPFGEYILRRLISIGTKSVFGVPGDYNLNLLEYFYDTDLADQVRWIGCCNELNAAYATDGYSRYTNKIGCVITTLGVGELSALNGIAGACCEDVRVLHIVGIGENEFSSDPHVRDRNMHHMLPDMFEGNLKGPNHRIFYEMINNKVSCSSEYLEDISLACDKVDKVIGDIYRFSKPGYLFIPASFSDQLVNCDNLCLKPVISLSDCRFITQQDRKAEITQLILDALYSSETPAILGDVHTDRCGIVKKLNQFVELTKMWNFSTVMGKSILDETNPTYMGVYNGRSSLDSVAKKFLSCDFIMNFGIAVNEVNYGFYFYNYKENATVVQMHPTYVRFYSNKTKEEKLFKGVNFSDILECLLERIDVHQLKLNYDPNVKCFSNDELIIPPNDGALEMITQPYLQKLLPEYFSPGDVIVSDTGSFQFALRDFKLASQTKLITQGLYVSIGTALPMALGVGIAMQDYPRYHILNNDKVSKGYQPKLILFEGDGSAQMTIQELSTMIRFQVPMQIFLLNNNGYTIERAIKGPTRSYNDIMPWKWTLLLEAFGDFDGKFTRSETFTVRKEMETRLHELKTMTQKGIVFHELKLGTFDIPTQLSQMISSRSG